MFLRAAVRCFLLLILEFRLAKRSQIHGSFRSETTDVRVSFWKSGQRRAEWDAHEQTRSVGFAVRGKHGVGSCDQSECLARGGVVFGTRWRDVVPRDPERSDLARAKRKRRSQDL